MIKFLKKIIKNAHVKNFSWITTNQIATMLLGMVSSIFVTRFLGPSNYGMLAYWQSFIVILTPLMSLGTANIITRDLAIDMSSTNKIISAGVILQLFLSLLVLFIAIICGYILVTDRYYFYCFSIIVFSSAFTCFSSLQLYFQVSGKFKVIFFMNFIASGISIGIRLLLVYKRAGLFWFCLASVFDGLISASLYFIIYNKAKLKIIYNKEVLVRLKAMLIEAWPLAISSLGIMLQARLDLILMKKYCSAYSIGQYALALKLIEYSNFVPVAISQILGPKVIQAKAVSKKYFDAKLATYYRVYIITFLIEAALIVLFAKPFILTLYGSAFAPSVALLYWFTLRLLLTNLGVAQSVYLSLFSLFKFSAINSFFGVVINIISLWIFLPKYGPLGAIFSMIISFTITICFTGLLVDKMRINLFLMYKSMFTFFRLRI